MDLTTLLADQIEDVCQRLRILSVETRLRMLVLLRERDLCVGALACRLGLTQGAVSQHLKVLRDAGIVAAERDGYYVHYRVNADRLGEWREQIDELLGHFQAGQGDEATTGETKPARCRKHKEEPCARTGKTAAVRRSGT